MNSNSWFHDREYHSKVQQNGFALVELALALPLFLIVAFGALELSRQLHTSLAFHTRQLNAALSAEQVPASLRRSSLWPTRSAAEQSSLRWSESTSRGIFYDIFITWLCHRPPVASPPALIPEDVLVRNWLLPKLDQARNQTLSLQRAACLVESSGRLGPQGSLAVLLSINALPSENARRASIITFCPVTARIAESARQSVAMQGVSLHLSSLSLERSHPSTRKEACH